MKKKVTEVVRFTKKNLRRFFDWGPLGGNLFMRKPFLCGGKTFAGKGSPGPLNGGLWDYFLLGFANWGEGKINKKGRFCQKKKFQKAPKKNLVYGRNLKGGLKTHIEF